MDKVIFGKVTDVVDYTKSCRCYSSDPKFYIGDKDYFYEIKNYYSVSYLTFPLLYDELKDIEFGEYSSNDEKYNSLKEFCSKTVLANYYVPTESVYQNTCYSEWTCGFPGEREVCRLGELGNLIGKYVIFILGY